MKTSDIIYKVVLLRPTVRHICDYWDTFDVREICLNMSPGSFAPYLIIVASLFQYCHTHLLR